VDPRYQKLARILVHHSLRLQKGEVVYLHFSEVDPLFVEVLIDTILDAGGVPLLHPTLPRLSRKVILRLPEDGFRVWGECEKFLMEKVQAYIGIRGGNNAMEFSDIPSAQMNFYKEYVLEPVHHKIRVPKTKWVVLRWPTEGMAQQAMMSTASFTDFYFQVCTMDYGLMEKALLPLKERMERTDRVRIVGPNGTDLTFSIRGIPVIPCFGLRNIPDGECFTAPVRESVEGVIEFNAPTLYEGVPFEGVRLTFSKGKIVSAESRLNSHRLKEILDTDEGARYVGEFSIGINPFIEYPMRDILFDEKIWGSIHFTPGNAYEVADNGNRSKIHWDLVLIQRKEFGGGEIWFDEELIRKDGLFVPEDLQPLNPGHLRKTYESL